MKIITIKNSSLDEDLSKRLLEILSKSRSPKKIKIIPSIPSIDYDRVPREPKYWHGMEDQIKYLRAFNKIIPSKSDLEILNKYKYTGVPPIHPNIKNIIRDFPELLIKE